MSFVEHLIVGGGISGCVMARHLIKRNLNFKLIEAHGELGGRIQGSDTGLDLGPTWFWPHQQGVEALLADLNIGFFAQYNQGDYVYQAGLQSPVQRGRDQQAMLSYRVTGGMGAMISALKADIKPEQLLLNSPVSVIHKYNDVWTLQLSNGRELSCQHLWLAMPPRKVAPLFLAAEHCLLSDELISHLQSQQTWMSAQAKFVAEYETPFWRDAGLSGQGFSRVGPMVEINDACGSEAGSPAALFGFIGVPAVNRQTLDKQQIIDACLAQLAKLFGEAALNPINTHYVDWAANEFVASAADVSEASQHAHFNQDKFKTELMALNLGLIGSEFSQSEPGYVAGAIDHVNQVAAGL